MRTSVLIASAACLAAASAAAAPPAHSPDGADCARQIKRQTTHGKPADAACWRLGPVALGMSAAEVARLIGPPDHEGPGPTVTLPSKVDRAGYRDAYYVFPRDLAQHLAREPAAHFAMRILQISYFQDRAVRLDTGAGVAMRSPPCAGAASELRLEGEPADFAPFRSFAGLREGDSIATLIRRFGKPNTISTAHDFYTYMPTPLTLDIDTDRNTVGRFSIGVDTDAVFLGGMPRLELTKDPATCRITGYSFLAARPDAGP